MSAVPDNILTFSSADPYPNPFIATQTQATDYGTVPLSDGQPDNVVNVPRSDGISVSGALQSFSATADSLLTSFSKVVSLNSAIENAKFQREVAKTTTANQQAATRGTLDIQKAAIDANTTIELARAKRATADALAQTDSGAAGYIQKAATPQNTMILAGVLVLALVLYFRRGKAAA